MYKNRRQPPDLIFQRQLAYESAIHKGPSVVREGERDGEGGEGGRKGEANEGGRKERERPTTDN